MARGEKAQARRSRDGDDYVHERPAWIIPILILLGVLTFSGAFLYYYFGPTPGELLGLDPRSSARSSRVETIIGDTRFLIPENYTRYPTQRGGGRRSEISLHALLPGLRPYSTDLQAEFGNHSAKSDVVYFVLSEASTPLSAARRLKDIYSKYLTAAEPENGPGGLQLFSFRADTGYANQDLFVGKDGQERMVLIICDRAGPLVESPNCGRSLLLGRNLELSYRYKREHLDDWYEIDDAIARLVNGFEAVEPTGDLQGSIVD